MDADWKNGCAFLGLFNGAVQGSVDMSQVDPEDAEGNIAGGIELFQAFDTPLHLNSIAHSSHRALSFLLPVQCVHSWQHRELV